MLPLARVPMLRSVLVRMPRQALAVRSVMEPVMGRAMGQGTKGSDLKTAPALERWRNNALDPPTFDMAPGQSHGRLPRPFLICSTTPKLVFFEAIRRES
jgi:hypothetical protein